MQEERMIDAVWVMMTSKAVFGVKSGFWVAFQKWTPLLVCFWVESYAVRCCTRALRRIMCSWLAGIRINLENYTKWKIAVLHFIWHVSTMLSPWVCESFPNLISCFQKPSNVHWMKLYDAFVIWSIAAGAQFLSVLYLLSFIKLISLRPSFLFLEPSVGTFSAHLMALIRATAGPRNWEGPIQSSQFCHYYNVRLPNSSEWLSSSWVHILLTVRLLSELVLLGFICLFLLFVSVMSLCVDPNSHSTNMPTTSIQTEMLLLPTPSSQLSQQGMMSNPLIGTYPAHTLGMICWCTDMHVCKYVEGECRENAYLYICGVYV